ncbi:Paired amphipathic helix protein Sin3-like 4 [Capsicum baccatum]|uniref:Paired amphipathic helix protein Sin3-like 4 n=1 Tax=Capsicum baccatum TaxID=33114 RepID=A0A2G2XIC0_CAPBA|nr:Paired amphipathic helix protein Sin3-like 4 [Capsicum baccatum]
MQERFRNNDHVYISFLDILKMYREEHKNNYEVYHEVAVLFNDHPNLLDEFTNFLPDSSTNFKLRKSIDDDGGSCVDVVGGVGGVLGPEKELDGYPKKARVERLNAGNRDLPTQDYGTLLCDLMHLDSCRPNLGLWPSFRVAAPRTAPHVDQSSLVTADTPLGSKATTPGTQAITPSRGSTRESILVGHDWLLSPRPPLLARTSSLRVTAPHVDRSSLVTTDTPLGSKATTPGTQAITPSRGSTRESILVGHDWLLSPSMKRLRNDVNDKCLFGSFHEESYNQSQVPASALDGRGGNRVDGVGASKPKLTIDDAFSYLKQVRDMFPDQREKYTTFLQIMINFKNRRIDTIGVISIVKELFKGHPNLLHGLNPFLPEGYEILILNEDEKKANYYEQALTFVGKIKERLGNGDEYKSFLDIMCKYGKERNDVNKLYHKIATLLNDYPDLLEEFTRFFPDDSVTINLLSNLNDDRTSLN